MNARRKMSPSISSLELSGKGKKYVCRVFSVNDALDVPISDTFLSFVMFRLIQTEQTNFCSAS